jgi:hypothetical protein
LDQINRLAARLLLPLPNLALPADTKISFAQPEFVVVQKKAADPVRKTPSPSIAPKFSKIEIDERSDPEAESRERAN